MGTEIFTGKITLLLNKQGTACEYLKLINFEKLSLVRKRASQS